MARIFYLRDGTGEGRIASCVPTESKIVIERLIARANKRVKGLPTFGDAVANPVANPRYVVIEITETDVAICPSVDVGTFLLLDTPPTVARGIVDATLDV